MLPAVKRVGRAYAARRGRRSGDFGSTSRSLRDIDSSAVDTPRDDARAGGDALAGRHRDLPLRPEQDVHARPELDQPDALAFFDPVADLLPEDDAAGNQAGDLFEDDRR